jgi:hypothetical protein
MPVDEPDTPTVSTPQQTAEFIQANARELAELAKACGWSVLAHLLDMATLEAGQIASTESTR